ncbi:MAG: hypothetical protein OEL89_03345 [Candidatus Peregrinibacteria bacterium]|nr:hypothetical protein [Candidatus Peregrinibacteria bacterium]
MTDSQIFQAFATLYVAIGFGIIINLETYKKIFANFVDSKSTTFITGLLSMVVGFLIMIFHNTWTSDLTVIITIMGWLAFTKGALVVLMPNVFTIMVKTVSKSKTWLLTEGIVALLLGASFMYISTHL